MAPDVQVAFFSYSREDQEFALKLAQDLRTGGAHIWLDQIDIEPGMPWDRAVQQALESSPRMLVILSPKSTSSDNVSDEVGFALDNHKLVIPVLYRDCDVPFRLRRLQYVDFRAEYTHALDKLLKALAGEISGSAAFAAADSGRAVRAEPEPIPSTPPPSVAGVLPTKDAPRRSLSPMVIVAAAGVIILGLIFWTIGSHKPNRRVDETQSASQESSGKKGSSPENQDQNLLPSSLSSKWAPTYHQALAGDAASMADLGWVYYNGDGATRDYQQAEKWFKKAADLGNANGMSGMGSIFLEVRGTPEADKKAFAWYQKAAAAGDTYGMYSIGYMYEYGRGVPQDKDLAITWYRKAANLGNQYAKDGLKRLGAKP